jgi:cyclopropane fatty-acyl-phospholipid synthase-like methyltransferase
MNQPPETDSYDLIPYAGLAQPFSHPDHLATVAQLFGVAAAPPDACRVLELGCGDAGNLIPMAAALPNSRFYGFDRSQRQIDDALNLARELDLQNLVLEQRDLRDLDESLGQFDYIIAHGLFSWIPKDVQHQLLDLCRRLLAPNGLAYISYNTLPGWRLRGAIREMMLFHSQGFASPAEQVAQSRALINFLADATGRVKVGMRDQAAYHQLLQSERDTLNEQPDFYVYHDHMEPNNNPLYFHEFIAQATQHQLRFLSEAHVSTMLPTYLPDDIAATLADVAPDILLREQYLDFLMNRTFRQTLLCHATVAPNYNLHPGLMSPLSFTAEAEHLPTNDPRYDPALPKVVGRTGTLLSLKTALSAAALGYLIEQAPRAVPFAELLAFTRQQVGTPDAASDAERLGDALLRCFSAEVVQPHVWQAPVTLQSSANPVAIPIARAQSRRFAHVTNLWHRNIQLGPIGQLLLPLLNGSNGRAIIEAIVLQHLQAEATTPDLVADTAENRERVTMLVEQALQQFAKQGLLVA